ncbi:MAG: UDP-N-acetylglucosamine 2-epimerase [Candidatus Omnitrophica bacterium]|nr:UDP-N-acetylglucosamine 2-epimerase [Candidatus Omnitrophota bacterium]
MVNKKVLLMYITSNSGHYRASLAIESALKTLSPGIVTMNINGFAYTNPFFEKLINRTYMSVIRNNPKVWEYLYDNPKVLKSVQGMRNAIHKSNSKKLKILIEDEFKPDAVVCTQAFPCGMVADYKKYLGLTLPLFGVLTDHAPHSYWIFDHVDYYIVPSELSRNHFIKNGVSETRIRTFGIPIDPRFCISRGKEETRKNIGLDAGKKTVLIMGGSQGMGPVEKMVDALERIEADFQILAVCGINNRLQKVLTKRAKRYKKKMLAFGLVENVDELMEASDVIITKPGGLTTSEALAKNLPMIIIHPIPGQETKNTDFLLQQGVALRAEDEEDVAVLMQELFSNSVKLDEMRRKANLTKKPNSATDIAQLILHAINNTR